MILLLDRDWSIVLSFEFYFLTLFYGATGAKEARTKICNRDENLKNEKEEDAIEYVGRDESAGDRSIAG